MRTIIILFLGLLAALPLTAGEADSLLLGGAESAAAIEADSLRGTPADSAAAKPKGGFWRKMGKGLGRFLHNLNDFDTTYIEANHYDWTVQLQSANNYEKYVATTSDGRKLSFSPSTSWRVGPYVGWRFLMWGYTLDLGHLSFGSPKDKRRTFSLSIYTNMLIIDTYWFASGNDFRISDLSYNSDLFSTGTLRDLTAEGIDFNVRGLNITYYFNHRHYAHKSVYAQSTQQRRSAGSFMLGLGYTRHSMTVDWEKMNRNLDQRLGVSLGQLGLDTLQMFNKMKFADLSLTFGYGYNWVFAKNWVANATLTLAFAYNQPRSYDNPSAHLLHFHDFSLKNINMYEMGRVGVMWRRKRWYGGGHALLRNYNFRRDQLSIRHTLAQLNLYWGYYIGKYHD